MESHVDMKIYSFEGCSLRLESLLEGIGVDIVLFLDKRLMKLYMVSQFRRNAKALPFEVPLSNEHCSYVFE